MRGIKGEGLPAGLEEGCQLVPVDAASIVGQCLQEVVGSRRANKVTVQVFHGLQNGRWGQIPGDSDGLPQLATETGARVLRA